MNFRFYIIVFVILAVLGTSIYLFKGKDEDNTSDDALADVNENNLSYSQSWYSQTADSLQTFLSSGWLTDEQVNSIVVKIASLKNKDDWNMLVYKFGKRTNYNLPFIIWDEGLVKWLIFRLKDVEYTHSTHTANALDVVRFGLSKIGVSI